MNTLKEYTRMNNSFKDICIYRIGNHAGYFSEINNMIIAMVYCLEHNIRFQLYSTDAMYCNDIWRDFFQPFTEHVTHPFHINNNTRDHKKVKISDFNAPHDAEIKAYLDKTFLTQDIFLTQHVWPFIRDRKVYNPEHQTNTRFISGSMINTGHQIIKSIWNYLPAVREKIQKIKNNVRIDRPYAGIHIRRGDKHREIPFKPLESYFNIVDSVTHDKNYPVFIATDDQRIIEDVKKLYPRRPVYHFSFPDNTGFDMKKNFQPLTKEQQTDKLIQLFAEVEMLIEAKMFVGTFTSNVGMFVGMARNGREIYGADTEKWIVW